MFQAIRNLFKPKPITLAGGMEISKYQFLERVFKQPAIFSPVYRNDDYSDRLEAFKLMLGTDLKHENDILVPAGTSIHVPLRGTFKVNTSDDMERLLLALETQYVEPW